MVNQELKIKEIFEILYSGKPQDGIRRESTIKEGIISGLITPESRTSEGIERLKDEIEYVYKRLGEKDNLLTKIVSHPNTSEKIIELIRDVEKKDQMFLMKKADDKKKQIQILELQDAIQGGGKGPIRTESGDNYILSRSESMDSTA